LLLFLSYVARRRVFPLAAGSFLWLPGFPLAAGSPLSLSKRRCLPGRSTRPGPAANKGTI